MAEPCIRFLVGGVQKGGTTALARALSQHPGIALPERKPGREIASGDLHAAWLKEAHVFDAPDFEEDWTPAQIDARFAGCFHRFDQTRLHGDATPLSLYHPRVVARVARYHPGMRWIVLLRDPVERAISHYFMERSRGQEQRSLLRAVLAEPARLRGSFDDFSRSAAWRRASYADRGRYTRQLRCLFSHFPREQVLLLKSLDMDNDALATVARALSFLGLSMPTTMVAPGRVFEGGYVAPNALSPGRLLLQWRLRGESSRLRKTYGVSLDTE